MWSTLTVLVLACGLLLAGGMPLVGDPEIYRSPFMLFLGVLLNKPTYRREDTSYFLIASLYVEYVARDITIDGGVFHHFEQSCSRRPWQVEAQLGVGVSHGGIDYFAGAVYHSDTYRRQDTNGFYGTFSGTWHW